MFVFQTHTNTHQESIRNGIFTAPISGHYFFQFHALVEAGKMAKLQVKTNTNYWTYIKKTVRQKNVFYKTMNIIKVVLRDQ